MTNRSDSTLSSVPATELNATVRALQIHVGALHRKIKRLEDENEAMRSKEARIELEETHAAMVRFQAEQAARERLAS